MLKCLWTTNGKPCQQKFDCIKIIDHLSEAHVGRKVTNNLCLTCHWKQCGRTFTKRDHLTSHLKSHIPVKTFTCSCGKTYKWLHDYNQHLIKTSHGQVTKKAAGGMVTNYFLSDDQGLSDHSSITDVSFYGVDAPSPSYIDSFNSAYPESYQSDSYRPDNDYRSYESSQLNTPYESSHINAHYESSQLNARYESSQINAHYESSQLNARYESSQLNAHDESSHLNAHYESSELTEHHHRPKHYRDTPENEPKLINMKRPKLIVPLITITPVDGPEQEFVFEDEEIYAMFNRPIKEKQAFADSHNIELDDNNETFPVEGTRLFDSPE